MSWILKWHYIHLDSLWEKHLSADVLGCISQKGGGDGNHDGNDDGNYSDDRRVDDGKNCGNIGGGNYGDDGANGGNCESDHHSESGSGGNYSNDGV